MSHLLIYYGVFALLPEGQEKAVVMGVIHFGLKGR